MNRIARLFIAVVVCCISHSASAQEPYQKWLEYFNGGWTSESSDGQRGEVVFEYVPGKYALVGKRPSSAGGVQLVGWQPDRQVLVDTEYGADGSYSVIEYTEFGEREMRGTFVRLSNQDGNFSGASIVITIESENLATAVIDGKNDKGEVLKVRSTFHRKERVARSQEATGSVPDNALDNTRYLVGNWVAEVELEGQERSVKMSVKPMPGEVGYVIQWQGPGGPGKPDTRLTAVGGWDASEQVFREMGFATNGDFFEFVYKQTSESTFEAKGTGTYMGKKMHEKVFVDRQSRNAFTWKASEIVVGGEKMPDEVYLFHRVEEGNALAQALDLEKDFGWLIGSWRSEFVIDREYEGFDAKIGDVVQEEKSYTWGLDRKFIKLRRTLRIEGKKIASATDFIGYDPESKKMKQWGFYSTGGHGSGLWSRTDVNSKALTWSTIDAVGKKDSGKFIQKKIDDDTLESVTVDRMVDGEKIPDSPKIISRRVK